MQRWLHRNSLQRIHGSKHAVGCNMAKPPDQHHAPSGSPVLPKDKPAKTPQTTWVLRSQIPSAPSDICCSGMFLPQPVCTVVMARGTWLELLRVSTPGQGQPELHSISCQPVFGMPLDLQALPVPPTEEAKHSSTAQVPRDLLLMLSDSGMLSVLMYCSQLSRFISVQQLLLAPAGLQSHTPGRQIRVTSDGGAVVVAACKNNLELLTVMQQHAASLAHGSSTAPASTAAGAVSLKHQLAAALHTVLHPTDPLVDSAAMPHAGTLVTVLESDPLLYRHAGNRFRREPDLSELWQDVMELTENGTESLAAALEVQAEQQGQAQADVGMVHHGDDMGMKDDGIGGSCAAALEPAAEAASVIDEEAGQPMGEPSMAPMLYAMEDLAEEDQQQGEMSGALASGNQEPASMQMTGLQLVLKLAEQYYEEPGGFTIWDVAWLCHDPCQSHHHDPSCQGHVQERWLLCLTHRPGCSHSDLTLLHWLPQRRLIQHAARLTLPHSSSLGVPTQLKAVPHTHAGVVILGTSSLLLLDCSSMMRPPTTATMSELWPTMAAMTDAAEKSDTHPTMLLHTAQGGQATQHVEHAAWQQQQQQQQHLFQGHGDAAQHTSRVLSFPALGPYAEAMAESIAAWLRVPVKDTVPSQSVTNDARRPLEPLSTPQGGPAHISSTPQTEPATAAATNMAAAEAASVLAAGPGPQHVAMCAAWLQPPTLQQGQHNLVAAGNSQTLVVFTSTGAHMALTVHSHTAVAGHNEQQTDAYRTYCAQLPPSKLSFTCYVAALEPAGMDLEPPTAVITVQDNLLLYCCSHISSRSVVQANLNAPLPAATAPEPRCPAVCFQPCITPGAQWSANYFACLLQHCLHVGSLAGAMQPTPAGLPATAVGMEQTTSSPHQMPVLTSPSHVTLSRLVTQPELGPLHGCVMGHSWMRGHAGGGRSHLYVNTCQCIGGGALPKGSSTSQGQDSQNKGSAASGELSSRLSLLHSSVPNATIASWPAGSFPAATGVWAIRAHAADVHDSVLIISFLAATRALAVGTDMCDVTDVLGVSSCEATVVAGLVEERLMVQVTSSAVYLLSLDPCLPQHSSSDATLHPSGIPQQGDAAVAAGIGSTLAQGTALHRALPTQGLGHSTSPAGRPRLVSSASHNKFSRLSADVVDAVEPLLLHPVASNEQNAAGMEPGSHVIQVGGGTAQAHVDSSVSGQAPQLMQQGGTCTAVEMVLDEEDAGTPMGSRTVSMSVDESAAETAAGHAMDRVQMSPLHNAMRNLAVAAGSCTTDATSETETSNQRQETMEYVSQPSVHVGTPAPTSEVAAPTATSVYDAGADQQDPCIWRPLADANALQQGAYTSAAVRPDQDARGGVGHILTAAVAQGCVVLQQTGSHTLQVLCVACESDKAPAAAGSSGSSSAPRKRRRPAQSLQHAGSIPWHNEVSCMQLSPEPDAPTFSGGHVPRSHHTHTHVHGSATHESYFLLLGHRQPGITLLRVVVTPGVPRACVQHQVLCHAGPPPMSGVNLQHVWEPPSAGLAVIPHSLCMTSHLVPRDVTHLSHTAGLLCEIDTPCHTNDPATERQALQPSQQLQAQPQASPSTRHQRHEQGASSSPAQEALAVVIQWLVGFRKGTLALYQWRGDASCTWSSSSGVNAAVSQAACYSHAELLWVVDLGATPLTLSPLSDPTKCDAISAMWLMRSKGSQEASCAKQQLSGLRAGATNMHLAWPDVLVIGDHSWVVSVAPGTHRVTWRMLDVGDMPLSLAASITLPGSVEDNSNDAAAGRDTANHSHDGSCTSHSSMGQLGESTQSDNIQTTLLLGVHQDTSWRLLAIGANGCSLEPAGRVGSGCFSAQVGAMTIWWSHLCQPKGNTSGTQAAVSPSQHASPSRSQDAAAAQHPASPSWEPPSTAPSPTTSSTPQLPVNWVTHETLTHAPTRSLILLGGYHQDGSQGKAAQHGHSSSGRFATLKQGIAAVDAESGRLMGLHRYSSHDTPTTVALWTTRVAALPMLSDVALPTVSTTPVAARSLETGEPSSPVYRAPVSRGAVVSRQARHAAEITSHPVILSPSSPMHDLDEDTSTPPSPTPTSTAPIQNMGPALSPVVIQYKQLLVVGFGSQDAQRPRLQGRIRVYQLLRYTMQYKGMPGSQNHAVHKPPADTPAAGAAGAHATCHTNGHTSNHSPTAGTSSGSSRSVMVWREEAELKLPGKVGALCALGPVCLLAAVDQRLACFTLQGGQLTKLGSLPTRSTITMLSACSSTRLVAGADSSNGVTLFLCDPQAQEPASVLQVVAADTLPRPVTSLLLLPNSLLTPITSHKRSTPSPCPPHTPGTPRAALPASPLLSPARHAPAGLLSAPPTPADAQAAAEQQQAGLLGFDLEGHSPEIQQLLMTAPATILAADATGCLTFLQAESVTLPPVRNLIPAGMLHVGDLCTQLVLGTVGTPPTMGIPWSQHQHQEPQQTGAIALLNCVANVSPAHGPVTPRELTLTPPHSHHSLVSLAAMANARGADYSRASVSAACASGALMELLEVTSSPAAALLSLLENALAMQSATQPVCGCEHARYRGQYQLDSLQTFTEPDARAVLDGDLLEMFLDLPWSLKRHVVTQVVRRPHTAATLLMSAANLMLQESNHAPVAVGASAGTSNADATSGMTMDMGPVTSVMLDAATLLMTHLLQQVLFGG